MPLESFPLFSILFLVSLSAFFSASETALFSLSRFQLRQLKQKSPTKFNRIRHLLDRPAALVATVLLGNELANVCTSHLLANFYAKAELSTAWITVINILTVMPIILIFGEITPKVIGAKANLSMATALLNPFWFFYRFSFPLRFLVETTVNFFTKGIRKRTPAKDDQIKEEDILQLLEDGKKKGAIHSVEQDIIENLFDIDDDKIADIATPLQSCFMVDQDENPKIVIEKLKKNFHSRVPVHAGNKEDIIGILYAKDLLKYINRDEHEMVIRDLMHEPLFIQANMKVEVVFRRLRQLKRHIAIVQNKQGKAIGVITMEDILEQMFGELWEENK